MFKKTMIATAILGGFAALSMSAYAADQTPDYSKGGVFDKDTVVELSTISGGNFVRAKDGAEGVSLTIKSSDDQSLTITGGTFSTSNHIDYAAGVVTDRGASIGLYNPDSGTTGQKDYELFTEDEIRAIFEEAQTNPDILKEKFSTTDGYTAEDLTVDDLDTVLAALRAAKNLQASQEVTGLTITSTKDIAIKGGTFDLNSANKSLFSADGKLVWENATLTSQGGGGEVEIRGATGLEILSGSIHSYGSQNGIADAYGFDYRGDYNRNRWTLGKYLGLRSNGDIVIGAEDGSSGPDIYVRDGMLAFFADASHKNPQGTIYLRGGSVTLHGVARSTLTSAWDVTDANSLTKAVMTGGELNIITEDELWANPKENVSMWTIGLDMKGGTANLYNSDLNSISTYEGDAVLNLRGHSALCNSITVKDNAVINLDPTAGIGALVGDKKGYASSATTIDIQGGTLNFTVTAPEKDNALVVGTNIAGLRAVTADDKAATLNLADTAKLVFNTGALAEGDYTAAKFLEVNPKEGSTITADHAFDGLFYKSSIEKAADGKSADLKLTVKNASTAIRTLTADDYLAKNAAQFGRIAATDTLAGAALAQVWAMENADDQAANAAAAQTLRDVSNVDVSATMFAQKNAADLMGREVFAQGSLVGNSADAADESGKRVWGTIIGTFGKVKGTTHQDLNTNGVVLGADHTFDKTLRAGLTFGALHTSTESDGADFEGDAYFFGLYGSWKLPVTLPVVLDADLMYGWTDGDLDTAMLGHSGRADIEGDTIRASMHASLPLIDDMVVPYVGLEWTRVSQDGYRDAALGRNVDKIDEDALTMPIGVKLVKTVQSGNALFTGTVDAAYARDLTDFDPVLTTRYAGAGIDSESADIGKDAFRFAVGGEGTFGAWDVEAQYRLEVRDNFTDNQVKATVRYNF